MVIENDIISQIQHYNTWPAQDTVKNMEVGASINYFGKIEFPNCYLTDISDHNLPHFTKVSNCEFGKCHFLDKIIDFFQISNEEIEIDRIIFCNPFKIGFRGKGYTKEFIFKAAEILNYDGEIKILCNSQNTWAKHRNAKKYIDKLTKEIPSLNYDIHISEVEEIDEEHRYRKKYKFVQTSIDKTTIPNEYYTIKIKPNDGNNK